MGTLSEIHKYTKLLYHTTMQLQYILLLFFSIFDRKFCLILNKNTEKSPGAIPGDRIIKINIKFYVYGGIIEAGTVLVIAMLTILKYLVKNYNYIYNGNNVNKPYASDLLIQYRLSRQLAGFRTGNA